ncbi:MAG: MarR family transcriptional regulator [Acidimicrobiales bacterium]
MTAPSDSTSLSAPKAVLAALAAHPDATTAELAETLRIGHSTAAKRLAALEQTGTVSRRPGGRDGSRRAPDRWSLVTTGAATETIAVTAPVAVRLGRGDLAQLVLGVLAAHPGEPFGPAGVAKRLGRSAGAVANALDRLVAAGEVALVSATPRRYRLAGSGAEADTHANPAEGKTTAGPTPGVDAAPKKNS